MTLVAKCVHSFKRKLLIMILSSVFFMKDYEGAVLELSAFPSYAVLNRPVTLTCTVSQAAGLVDLVKFWKKTDEGVISVLKQEMSKCSSYSNSDSTKYTPSCGSGTDSSSSSIKKYVLYIKKVSASDVTEWWCELQTQQTRSNNFSLLLSKGPDSVSFTPPPPDFTAEGQDLTVTCVAHCVPTCDFMWTVGNQRISSTSQLTLTNIRRSHTGNMYTCTATNTFLSQTKHKQFTLTVYYGPDSVNLNSSSPITVQEGDDVAVSCEATGCNPSCSYSWKFKSAINSASRVLTLNNIQRSSAGYYKCTAKNTDIQKSLDTNITVDVQYQSSITSLNLNSKQSMPVTVDELTNMTLRCDVDSNPGSTITLLNNSQTLLQVTNSKQAKYTWDEAGCLDTGNYTCEADNGIKSAVSKSVQLVVRCSPRLDHRETLQREFGAEVGGDVTMEISVIANPSPTFTWYKLTDGNRGKHGSGTSTSTSVSAVGKYTLTNVQHNDIGTYQVVVSNGKPRPSLVVNFTLKVAGPPDIPSDVIAWSASPYSISVSWIEESNGGSEQMFVVQYRLDTSTQWINHTEEFPEKGFQKNHTAVITNLEPKTRYLLRVLAYNKYGFQNFTKQQEALTLEGSEPPSSLLGGVAGGVTGGLVVIVVVIVMVVLFLRRRSRNSTPSEKSIMASDSNDNKSGPENSELRPNGNKGVNGNKTDEEKTGAVGGSPPSGDIYSIPDKSKKGKANDKVKAGSSGQADSGVGELYAVVDKSKKGAAKKAKKETTKAGGSADDGVNEMYAMVDKSKKKPVDKAKKKAKPKPKGKKKEAEDEKHIYGNDNMAFVKEDKPKKLGKGKQAPSAVRKQQPRELVYTTVEFDKGSPSPVVHQAEEPTVYIDLDFTKKAQPLPDDEENAN